MVVEDCYTCASRTPLPTRRRARTSLTTRAGESSTRSTARSPAGLFSYRADMLPALPSPYAGRGTWPRTLATTTVGRAALRDRMREDIRHAVLRGPTVTTICTSTSYLEMPRSRPYLKGAKVFGYLDPDGHAVLSDDERDAIASADCSRSINVELIPRARSVVATERDRNRLLTGHSTRLLFRSCLGVLSQIGNRVNVAS